MMMPAEATLMTAPSRVLLMMPAETMLMKPPVRVV